MFGRICTVHPKGTIGDSKNSDIIIFNILVYKIEIYFSVAGKNSTKSFGTYVLFVLYNFYNIWECYREFVFKGANYQ